MVLISEHAQKTNAIKSEFDSELSCANRPLSRAKIMY